MPLIGGTTSWVGPLIGAVLLGSLQQIATVTISSAVNLLIVGCLLVAFVIVAPNGIVGLVHKYLQRKPDDFVGRRRVETDAPGLRAMSELSSRSTISASASAALSRSKISRCRCRAGERLGLIGPNGSGKSTLVNCICGTLRNEQGSVRFDGRALDGLAAHQRTRLGLARSFQLPRPFVSMSLHRQHPHPAALHGRGARHRTAPRTRSRRAAPTCCTKSVSRKRRVACRAISRRSRCASSNWRAPWRRNRNS